MKNAPVLLTIALALTLTACATGEARDAVTTINPADWPTPPPASLAATATPFPMQAVEALAAMAIQADPSPTPEPPTPTPLPPTATPLPPTPPPPPAPPAAQPVTGTVASVGLNVRSGPGAQHSIVTEARQGDTLTVIAVDEPSGWLNVRTGDGVTGWVNAAFVTLSGATNRPLPPTNPAPAPGNPAPPAETGGTLLIQLTAGGDIMLINRDGTGLRRLTGGIDPALSPDGQKVAFTRWDGPTQGTLWVINVDGSGERAILGETKQIKGPSWSPDSKRIAVNFQEGGRLEVKSECWDLSKGDPPLNYWQAFDITTKVTFNQFGIPTFWICWKLPPDPHWQLRVINVSDGSFEDMPAGQYAFAPAWDPANPWRIVSAAGMGLVWTDVNRGVAEPLTNDPADRAPVFSPDGRYIAVTYHQHDHWEVHRLNAGGSGRVRLTKTPLYAVVDSPRQWNNAAPAFSPAGDEIAFLTDRAGRWEVWVMNVDGSNQRPMFSDAVNDQLPIEYHGNDERSLGWGR